MYTIELTDAELRMLHAALKSYLDDFGHEEADLLRRIKELIAAQLYPPLSTMELPHYQMGQWAVQYLLEHAQSWDDEEPAQHKIACPFIPRSSA